MVHVQLLYREQELYGFRMWGHSGYEERGRDIVCAGISALTINFLNSLDALTKDPFVGQSEEVDGMVRFRFTDTPSESGRLLIRSWHLGLEDIAREYGEEYLSLTSYARTEDHFVKINPQEV